MRNDDPVEADILCNSFDTRIKSPVAFVAVLIRC